MASGHTRRYAALPPININFDKSTLKNNTSEAQESEQCPHKHYYPMFIEIQNIDVISQPPKYTLQQLEENRIISYDEIIENKITSLCKQPTHNGYTHCDSMSLPCETTYFPCGINYQTLNKICFSLKERNFKDGVCNYLNKPGAYVIIPYGANHLCIPEEQKGFGNTFDKIITKKCNIPYHGLSELYEVVMFIGVDNEVWISIFNQ